MHWLLPIPPAQLFRFCPVAGCSRQRSLEYSTGVIPIPSPQRFPGALGEPSLDGPEFVPPAAPQVPFDRTARQRKGVKRRGAGTDTPRCETAAVGPCDSRTCATWQEKPGTSISRNVLPLPALLGQLKNREQRFSPSTLRIFKSIVVFCSVFFK